MAVADAPFNSDLPNAEGTEVEASEKLDFTTISADIQGQSSGDNGSKGSTHDEESSRRAPELERDDLNVPSPVAETLSPTSDVVAEPDLFESGPAVDTPVLPDVVTETKSWTDGAQEAESPASAPGQPQSLLARPAASTAWLRSMLAHHEHNMGLVEGWQVLNVKLDDEQGNVTVKARREEEKVSVSVGFTDPGLRAVVQANAQRIEQTLEAQYQTSVDLSFFTGNEEQGSAGGDLPRGPETGSGMAAQSSVEHAPVTIRRPKPLTALREWVV